MTAIIDGTGSIGAAVGPFLAGAIPGKDTRTQLNNTFYLLMAANVISLFVSNYSVPITQTVICFVINNEIRSHLKYKFFCMINVTKYLL